MQLEHDHIKKTKALKKTGHSDLSVTFLFKILCTTHKTGHWMIPAEV